jgi:Lhr-like helicase
MAWTTRRCPSGYFSADTRAWFENAFDAPTAAQEQAWPAISRGEHVLVCAPTGSGKTLAAFLWALDRLSREPSHGATRVVYVSPLKALAYDIERNLRAPLRGIGAEQVRVAIRTGDTPQRERAAMARKPPDVLVTTPESLYLILTSLARTMLEGVQAVIVDEIHAVAHSKRGAHLALTLERLERQAAAGGARGPLQRIGLSATQNPLAEIAPLPWRAARESDRRRGAQADGPADRGAGRVDERPDGAVARRGWRGLEWETRNARSGRRSTRSCCARSANATRRSSSSTAAGPPSGWRPWAAGGDG